MPPTRDMPPRIALLLDMGRDHSRQLVQGIARFLSGHTVAPFAMELVTCLPTGGLRRAGFQAVLTSGPQTMPLRTTLPVVMMLEPLRTNHHTRAIGPDHQAAGTLGLEHLLAMGYEHVAWFGVREDARSRERCKGFRAAARLRGLHVHMLNIKDHRTHAAIRRKRQQPIHHWMEALPRPVGIMAGLDYWARDLMQAATAQGLRVPQEIGILGVDNHEVLAQTMYPALSSIDVDYPTIGCSAAEMLVDMLHGTLGEPGVQCIAPLGVLARMSTRRQAHDDPTIMASLRYIEAHLGRPIGVPDLLGVTGVNRRTLERLFQKHLGRSPYEEIQRLRIERAKHLLDHTRRTITQIAMDCGFGHGPNLAAAFGSLTGMSPRQYRQRQR